MSVLKLASLPRLSDHMRGPELDAALGLVGRYVASCGLEGVYGVQLLHAHFPVADTEAIVERTQGRSLSTRVVSRSSVAGLAVSTWGFTTDGTPVAIQWAEDGTNDANASSDVAGIGAFLAAQDLTTVFAVVVLDDMIEVGAGETLLETTDMAARTQLTVPVSLASVRPEQVATWSFTAGGVPVPRAYCYLDNKNH